jgi:hypothetical protein
MEGDKSNAIKYISQSQGHSRALGFREGVRESGEALARLRSS